MSKLELDSNRFQDPDVAYRLLVDAHGGLTDAESMALNARLILVLANQIGDLGILEQAIAIARDPQVAADGPGR